MTKKAIVGVVIAIAIIVLVAVLIWGLQPVQQQQVTYQQLLEKDGKLDGKIVPNNLPFDGVVEYCAITYPQGHDGTVPLRFELNDERATGYVLVVVGENKKLTVDARSINNVIDDQTSETTYQGLQATYKLTTTENVSVATIVCQGLSCKFEYAESAVADLEKDVRAILDEIARKVNI
ncbi:MAG: hypothetical protein ACI4MY_03600 [Christensenellales bacterium]